MLFIEYDVGDDGMIEVVGLINAIEENDEDPLGEDWMSWRQSFDDNGLGCVGRVTGRPHLDGVDRRSRADPGHCGAGHPGRSSDQRRGAIVSTTRSQLYRFARDLGNVEAVEHGYKRGGLSGAAIRRCAARGTVGSSTGKATARSTTSCVPSDSDRIGVERVPVPARGRACGSGNQGSRSRACWNLANQCAFRSASSD